MNETRLKRESGAAEFLLATPPGKGAIAVITLFAPQSAEIVQSFFVPKSGKPLASYGPGTIAYGTIFEEDVIVCPIREEEMEIHCHGSSAAVERLKGFLTEQGAREISVSEWVANHLNSKTENQKRAFEALLGAETGKIAAILWDQFQGAYEKAVQAGEETQRWEELARHLTRPWKVVMVGRPNVGKSSLFNRILGFPRAIVFEQAGTTRDLLKEKTVLSGWSVELTDTAGLHEACDLIECEGIRRARAEMNAADLILWIREVTDRQNAPDSEPDFPSGKRVLRVWNKADLLPAQEWQEAKPEEDEIFVSALNETGIEALLTKIIRTLIPEEPPAGTGMKIE